MLATGFVLLFVTMLIIILSGYNNVLKLLSIDNVIRKGRVIRVAVILFLWTVYMYILSYTGVLKNFDLPPRFPLLLIIPLFIFTGIFLYRHRKSEVLHAIPKSWPVYYQSFRVLVESLFLMSVAEGILPYQVTFEGYNMDMIFAASAPVVAFLAFNRKVISEKIVLGWNYLGLAVICSIIFLFITTIFIPSVWGSAVSLGDVRLGEFSNMLVPGFLMPTAVFMHILSIIQLQKSIGQERKVMLRGT